MPKDKDAKLWERHPQDWYVEPDWCSQRLFQVEYFQGSIHDPSCGLGRILTAASHAGYRHTGGDIVQRGGADWIRNFVTEPPWYDRFDNIVTNPPFGISDEFLEKALEVTRYKIAFLLPTKWANSDSRSKWLETTPLKTMYMITPRPSMPPGPVIEAGIKPGGGTVDFSWFIWEQGYEGTPELKWLHRKP